MRSLPAIAALTAAIALLPACGKQDAPETPAAAGAESRAADPFQRNGELLTINVDNMPRAAFIAKIAQLTGVKITAEGDNNQTVSIHVTDGTLRKVLSQVVADAPYGVTMTYTNIQDSFPASVSVTRYQSGLQQPAAAQRNLPPAVAGLLPQGAQQQLAAANRTQAAPAADDQPDFSSMPADEQLKYFLAQNPEDQAAIIFDLEPSKSDIALMGKLMVMPEISSDVKQEMLDSLSTADYEDSAATIKLALAEKDPEVAVKAAEVLSGVGSDADIPALKTALENTDNEEVRTALSDAIETLEP